MQNPIVNRERTAPPAGDRRSAAAARTSAPSPAQVVWLTCGM